MQWLNQHATFRFALYGVLFGACFPVIATAFDVWIKGMAWSWQTLLALHSELSLHWIINTAPLFLGVVAALAGKRQANIETLNEELEERVAIRTAELLEANVELQNLVAYRERTEEKLSAALEQARSASKAKSDFLATMSHEIRTPLNGVIGMTGLLLDSGLNEEQMEYASTVRSSGEALLTVINDILDFSKIEAGRIELEAVDFNLRTVIEETIDLVVHKADEQGIELAFLIQHNVPSWLSGDPGRLRQILLNLLSNAVKFTQQGEVVLCVDCVATNNSSTELKFEVRDTGIGISEEAQRTLFDAFSQADASTTRKFGGTGLGLSIAHQLCHLMGGGMGVKSRTGEGSTFWFTASFETNLSEQHQPVRVPLEAMHDLRVLIVDDNQTNRQIISHNITPWGCAFTEAESGEEALQLLREAIAEEKPFNLVLMDFQMPNMDGAMLAEAIRKDPANRNLPLILLTSMGQQGDFRRMRDLGFAGYLIKPVKPSQLFDCVALVLGADRLEEQSALITEHSLTTGSRPIRILVAEDNLVNQKVAVRTLQKAGFSCDVAANGLEATQAVAQLPYDLILMDCQMPEMDGLSATRHIRSTGSRTPIIAMTASAMQEDQLACEAAGMDDFISKPVRPESLIEAVVQWTKTAGPGH